MSIRSQAFICCVMMLVAGASTSVQADVREAAKKVIPATVSIDFARTTQDLNNRKFALEQLQNSVAIAMSQATGICVSSDGLIVSPMIGGKGSAYKVTFPGAGSHDAKLLVVDHRSGLALLKADAKNLPFVKVADGKLEVGQSVLATGSVSRTDRSLASGIISSTKRRLRGSSPEMIQTDIAVGSVKHGAPIVDTKGRLVGVVTGNHGSRFGGMTLAVGNELVQRLLKAAKGDGVQSIHRGYLGVRLVPAGTNLVKVRVMEGGPAEKVGFKDDDIIVSIDGESVAEEEDVVAIVSKHQPGETIKIKRRRGEEDVVVEVELGQAPAPAASRDRSQIELIQPEQMHIDIHKDLLEQLRRHGFDPDKLQIEVQPNPGQGKQDIADRLRRLLGQQALQVQRSGQSQQIQQMTKQIQELTKRLQEMTRALEQVQKELEAERKKNQQK
ncbi:MAG: hypothetical protein CMJ78_18430 [Planctomycetaceae bacterium]|nr:hypothetical protein [Planctomycetaceae bacterium]